MTEEVRVFISWSGERSKYVAKMLRGWLPNVFDSVVPFMSDVDIESGSRGLDDIRTSLSQCSFGLIVVTEENQNRNWLNFESGAISKTLGDDRSHVVPLLVDLESPAQLTGPLSQFQARMLSKDGLERVVKTLADLVGLAPETAMQRFAWSWTELEKQLAQLPNVSSSRSSAPRRSQVDMLEEVLMHVRRMAVTSDHSARDAATPVVGGPISSRELRELADLLARNDDPELQAHAGRLARQAARWDRQMAEGMNAGGRVKRPASSPTAARAALAEEEAARARDDKSPSGQRLAEMIEELERVRARKPDVQ